jgi:hypothetical protein
MEISATKIWFDDSKLFASLSDGRVIGVPLSWFPRLMNASKQAREKYELWRNGKWIHWDEIDEDLSVEGFFTYSLPEKG